MKYETIGLDANLLKRYNKINEPVVTIFFVVSQNFECPKYIIPIYCRQKEEGGRLFNYYLLPLCGR